MNSFRERITQKDSKEVDSKIREVIYEELTYLESTAEFEVYKAQIGDRRNGILAILENFNRNMGIIEQTRGVRSNQGKVICGYEEALDRIIRKKIRYRIENLYEDKLQIIIKGEGKRKAESDRELIQIRDRQERLEYLLDDYPNSMTILKNYNDKMIHQRTRDMGLSTIVR